MSYEPTDYAFLNALRAVLRLGPIPFSESRSPWWKASNDATRAHAMEPILRAFQLVPYGGRRSPTW